MQNCHLTSELFSTCFGVTFSIFEKKKKKKKNQKEWNKEEGELFLFLRNHLICNLY